MLKDFISLIYPHLCSCCSKPLYKKENCICTWCRYHLPKTNYHRQKDNPLSRIFWGRVDIYAATSYYFFAKGGNIQRLIHRLKYRGNTAVGEAVGRFLAHDMKESDLFDDVDCIVPVPLHPTKQRKRGYNQSEHIANGLSQVLEVETNTDNLYRAIANPTQTKRSTYQRWENVASVFQLRDPAQLAGKHILLVDDVVTTGSTIEACTLALNNAPESRVSVATMAYATLS